MLDLKQPREAQRSVLRAGVEMQSRTKPYKGPAFNEVIMSAEGKKKNGVSGLSKANRSPYRLNGGGLFPLYVRKIMASAPKSLDEDSRGSEKKKESKG